MTVGFPIIAIIVILAAVFLARQPDPQKRARILRQAGFGMMALTTAFFGLFVASETFTDPGGWQASGWSPPRRSHWPPLPRSPGIDRTGRRACSRS